MISILSIWQSGYLSHGMVVWYAGWWIPQWVSGCDQLIHKLAFCPQTGVYGWGYQWATDKHGRERNTDTDSWRITGSGFTPEWIPPDRKHYRKFWISCRKRKRPASTSHCIIRWKDVSCWTEWYWTDRETVGTPFSKRASTGELEKKWRLVMIIAKSLPKDIIRCSVANGIM